MRRKEIATGLENIIAILNETQLGDIFVSVIRNEASQKISGNLLKSMREFFAFIQEASKIELEILAILKLERLMETNFWDSVIKSISSEKREVRSSFLDMYNQI